ncbi:hypothetical protein [Paenibacillus sp. NPDC057967]|uniref:hypothetical protein n=1 Tax=Paenibacillus sp. NPDC057967 TaxID=3346293 RepID=UPI0036DC43CE
MTARKMNTLYDLDVTNEMLYALSKSGHSMRSNQVEDKRLIYAVVRHYGSWRKMIIALGFRQAARISNYEVTLARTRANYDKIKWTREVIYESLLPLINEGLPAMKIKERNSALYSAVTKHYGGVAQFCEEHGLPLIRDEKYTKAEVDAFIDRVADTYENYASVWLKASGTVDDRRLCYAAIKRYGSWNKALIARNKPLAHKTPDKVRPKPTLVRRLPPPLVLYDKDKLDKTISEAIRGCSDSHVTIAYLNELDRNIVHSIRQHYGDVFTYFSGLDIDYYTAPYVPFRWNHDNIKRQLLRWISEGYPVNYVCIAQRHTGIINAARSLYGGWKQVFEACGLDYEDYRVDTTMASFYGHRFEDIVGEVLTAMGVNYTKYHTDGPCHPDFVEGNVWYDAKLSQWTVHQSDNDTVKKYEPYCDSLTIIFLRGDRSADKMISEKTRLVNIYVLIESLDDTVSTKIKRELDDIETELAAIA